MTHFSKKRSFHYDDQKLIDTYCARLRYLVEYRLHPRLRGRIPTSEVVTDVEADLRRRAERHRCSRPATLLRCLRSAAIQSVDRLSAEYLPSVGDYDPYLMRLQVLPGEKIDHITSNLLGIGVSAKKSVGCAGLEVSPRQAIFLQRAFNSLNQPEREHLCLQHFEQLRPVEAAVIRQLPLHKSGSFYCETMKKLRYRYFLQEDSSTRWFTYAHAG